jgi:hypothetical protein
VTPADFKIRVAQLLGVGRCAWPDGPGCYVYVSGEVRGPIGIYRAGLDWTIVDLETGLTIVSARSRGDARRLVGLLESCYQKGSLPERGSDAEARLAAICRAYLRRIWFDTLERIEPEPEPLRAPDHGWPVVSLTANRPYLRDLRLDAPVTQGQLAHWLCEARGATWRRDGAVSHLVVPLSGSHGVELAIPWRSVTGLPEVEALWLREVLPWLARFEGLTEDALICAIREVAP